jgi:hypothetical protein
VYEFRGKKVKTKIRVAVTIELGRGRTGVEDFKIQWEGWQYSSVVKLPVSMQRLWVPSLAAETEKQNATTNNNKKPKGIYLVTS